MFTGIVETIAKVINIRPEEENIHFDLSCSILQELYIDQSLSHNGVCLTVVNISDSYYTVTAIQETLLKSNFKQLKVGDIVNLERAMSAHARLDGHFVQGHVDAVLKCISIVEAGGSWYFTFDLPHEWWAHIVDKGSVCLNGTSLTVIKTDKDEPNQFRVAIIPYTMEFTNFHSLKPGDSVNVEFDILGKYILNAMKLGVGYGYDHLITES